MNFAWETHDKDKATISTLKSKKNFDHLNYTGFIDALSGVAQAVKTVLTWNLLVRKTSLLMVKQDQQTHLYRLWTSTFSMFPWELSIWQQFLGEKAWYRPIWCQLAISWGTPQTQWIKRDNWCFFHQLCLILWVSRRV